MQRRKALANIEDVCTLLGCCLLVACCAEFSPIWPSRVTHHTGHHISNVTVGEDPRHRLPVVDQGQVYIGNKDVLDALDLETGRLLWRVAVDGAYEWEEYFP